MVMGMADGSNSNVIHHTVLYHVCVYKDTTTNHIMTLRVCGVMPDVEGYMPVGHIPTI